MGFCVARRAKRLWSDEEKRSICLQTAAPEVSVAQVARRYGLNANLILKWLRDARYAPGPKQAAADTPCFLPVEIVDHARPKEYRPVTTESQIEVEVFHAILRIGPTALSASGCWRQSAGCWQRGGSSRKAACLLLAEKHKLPLLPPPAGDILDRPQYLLAEDVLGSNRGHMPRHSKVYRNFAVEFDRLQAERVAAFREFIVDVNEGGFPGPGNLVTMEPTELAKFRSLLKK